MFKNAIEKNIEYSLKEIESLKAESVFVVKKDDYPINDCLATLKYIKGKGFECKIFLKETPKIEMLYNRIGTVYGVQEDILLTNSSYNILIPKESFKSISTQIGEPQILTLHYPLITTIASTNASESKYFRLIIEDTGKIDFGALEIFPLKVGSTTHAGGIFSIEVDNFKFDIYKYKKDKTDYLVIDSHSQLNIYNFKLISTNILGAFGFYTGALYRNNFYYQSSVDRSFDYNSRIDIEYNLGTENIYTGLVPFDNLIFSQLLNFPEYKNLRKKVRPYISSKHIENLVLNLMQKEQLRRSLSLLIQGSHRNLQALRAGVLSIVLETITEMICEENIEKMNSIKDNRTATDFKNELLAILGNYKDQIDMEGSDTLRKKIQNINGPTNSKKLALPFEILGIRLSQEELKVLKDRNIYLHGRIPEKENDFEEEGIVDFNLKLLTLIYCLILKYIGYKGHIFNMDQYLLLKQEKELTRPLIRIFQLNEN